VTATQLPTGALAVFFKKKTWPSMELAAGMFFFAKKPLVYFHFFENMVYV
jgi:hypothetical protein